MRSRLTSETLKYGCVYPLAAISLLLTGYFGRDVLKNIDLNLGGDDETSNAFHVGEVSDEDVFSTIRRQENRHNSVNDVQDTLFANLETYREQPEFRAQVRLISELLSEFNLTEEQLETLIENADWLEEQATPESWSAARNLNETDPRRKLLTFRNDFDQADVFFLQENGKFTSAFLAPNLESALQGIFATVFARTNNASTATAVTNNATFEHGLDATGGYQQVNIMGQTYYVAMTSKGEIVLQRFENDVPSNNPADQENIWRCVNYYHFPEQAFPWANYDANAGSMQLVFVQQDAQTGRFEVNIYNVGDEATLPTDTGHEEFFNDDDDTEPVGFTTLDDCGPGAPAPAVQEAQQPPQRPPGEETPPPTPETPHKSPNEDPDGDGGYVGDIHDDSQPIDQPQPTPQPMPTAPPAEATPPAGF